MRRFLLLLPLLVLAAPAAGQSPRPLVVMNLAAHPDDEDGSTLNYYRYAKDAVAYSVIYTRGEGGQNEIGTDLYEALGALRTEETERAARILGTQVFFLNFYDFGYSKTAEEAFAEWGGRDAVTARLVHTIRTLKPDVLFTNHDTVTVGPRRQHGQHQAVGLSAYDAFALAADPSYHPEQLGEPGVDLWQPKRLFLRHWREPEAYDVAVPVGDAYAPKGQTHDEIAGEALREHASQGMGMFAGRFSRPATYFTLLRSATDAPLDPADLAGNLPPNRAASPSLSYLIASGRAPAPAEGLFTLADSVVVPGQRVRLTWDVDRLPERRAQWRFSGAVDTTLYLADQTPGVATLAVDPAALPTVPKATHQYARFLSHPPVTFGLYRAGTDELLAAGHLPLEVAPPVHAEVPEEVTRLRPGANRLPVRLRVFDPAAERVQLGVAVSREADRTVLLQETAVYAPGAGGLVEDTVAFTLPASLPGGEYTVTLTALASPTTLRATPVHVHQPARAFRTEVPEELRVGVVESYDNTLAQALSELGVDYVLLDSTALAGARFDGLHTIVVDIRAYLVRPGLRAHHDALLDWVRRGGHLVVNYQKTFEWNESYPDPFVEGRDNPAGFAPYPLVLGRDRVTREDAPVEVLVPEHPLFNEPNAIGEADWKGWVQERGLYFPETYDARYRPLVRTNDPGEAPLESSTLLAEYGAGTYLYTALAWYRQLKRFHPGAYRLFANQISLPLVDGRRTGTSSR